MYIPRRQLAGSRPSHIPLSASGGLYPLFMPPPRPGRGSGRQPLCSNGHPPRHLAPPPPSPNGTTHRTSRTTAPDGSATADTTNVPPPPLPPPPPAARVGDEEKSG